MPKAPKSYLNEKRPPLMEALQLEGGTVLEATKSLERKGYFTPPSRPWSLGYKDRGNGHLDYAVLDRFGDLVVKTESRPTAEFIISCVNSPDELLAALAPEKK